MIVDKNQSIFIEVWGQLSMMRVSGNREIKINYVFLGTF